MTFKVRKRLEIDRAAPAIKEAKREMEDCEHRIDRQRHALGRYKLELAPLKREYLCLSSVPDTSWVFLQAAGGSTTVANRLKEDVMRGFYRLSEEIGDYERKISRSHEHIDCLIIEQQQVKFRLRRAESMPNAIVTLDTDKLDSDLSVCDDYVNGSIKLKIDKGFFGENIYRITYQTPELIAHCARGERTPIVISPIYVDITMGSRNNYYVRFRSVNGLSNRFSGWGGHDLLHPHMTSTSEPCLGDFSGPIQDATEDYDIVTLVTLIGMFLRQFDPEDGAGSRFYNCPIHRPEPEPEPKPVTFTDSYPQRRDSVNTQLIDEMLDDIFADEDRCESDYADEYVRSY